MGKCSNGHKPPVRADWRVGSTVLCMPCVRAYAQKGSLKAQQVLDYAARKSTKRMLAKEARP
jgi:hypothetical protein